MTALDPSRRPEGRSIDANGIRTRCFEAGEGEPVILVHGGGPGADGFGNWQGCLAGFARSFRTIVVDMLGFGRSDKPDREGFVRASFSWGSRSLSTTSPRKARSLP